MEYAASVLVTVISVTPGAPQDKCVAKSAVPRLKGHIDGCEAESPACNSPGCGMERSIALSDEVDVSECLIFP